MLFWIFFFPNIAWDVAKRARIYAKTAICSQQRIRLFALFARIQALSAKRIRAAWENTL